MYTWYQQLIYVYYLMRAGVHINMTLMRAAYTTARRSASPRSARAWAMQSAPTSSTSIDMSVSKMSGTIACGGDGGGGGGTEGQLLGRDGGGTGGLHEPHWSLSNVYAHQSGHDIATRETSTTLSIDDAPCLLDWGMNHEHEHEHQHVSYVFGVVGITGAPARGTVLCDR